MSELPGSKNELISHNSEQSIPIKVTKTIKDAPMFTTVGEKLTNIPEQLSITSDFAPKLLIPVTHTIQDNYIEKSVKFETDDTVLGIW